MSKDKESNPELDALLNRLGDAIQDAFHERIGKSTVSEKTMRGIARELSEKMSQPVQSEHLQFMQHPKFPDKIVPANLYTALLIHFGIGAPPYEACADNTWESHNGTQWVWDNGEIYVKVPLPMNSIEVKFTATITEQDANSTDNENHIQG